MSGPWAAGPENSPMAQLRQPNERGRTKSGVNPSTGEFYSAWTDDWGGNGNASSKSTLSSKSMKSKQGEKSETPSKQKRYASSNRVLRGCVGLSRLPHASKVGNNI
eukprot:4325591-Pyramimonas_sp.AAC.2